MKSSRQRKGIEEQRGKGVDRGKVMKNREEKEQIGERY